MSLPLFYNVEAALSFVRHCKRDRQLPLTEYFDCRFGFLFFDMLTASTSINFNRHLKIQN